MKLLKHPLIEVLFSVVQILAGLTFLGIFPGVSGEKSWFSIIFGILLIISGAFTLWRQFSGKPVSNISISDLTAEDVAEIKQLIQAGKEIIAIKLVREKTGAGLADSKNFVESLKTK